MMRLPLVPSKLGVGEVQALDPMVTLMVPRKEESSDVVGEERPG